MKHPENCELGPIRPPSEAASLLLRITRNCPWNKCTFCAVYKQDKFSKRTEEEIIADINRYAAAAAKVRRRAGIKEDEVLDSREAVLTGIRGESVTEDERRVAFWLYRGGHHVFLQDADSLAIPAARVTRILRHLHHCFPTVNRVTTYARSRTLVAKSPDDLAQLREAGLTRIHVGLETACNELLEFISKGCTSEHHRVGLTKAIAAGFEVCCYVMPGLGGRQFSEAHARDTGELLKLVDPQHIRLRTLWLDPGSPLEEMYRQGQFEPLEEDEIVAEIRDMLQRVYGANGRVVSDHDRNLLTEIEGHLTDDADDIDQVLQQFLDLSAEIRDAFVLGRRAGYLRTLEHFLSDPAIAAQFVPLAREMRQQGNGSLVKGMMARLGPRSI